MNEVAVSAVAVWCVFPLVGLPVGLVAWKKGRPELLTRFFIWMAVITLFLGTSFFGEAPFALLLLGCGAFSTFELARLAAGNRRAPLWFPTTIIPCAFLLWAWHGPAKSPLWIIFLFVAAAGLMLSGLLLRSRQPATALIPLSASVGTGLAAWVFLQQLPVGFRFVLFAFSVVAASDIMAFVFGKLLPVGRPFPRLSPNKTTSGYFGGTASGVTAGYFLAFAIPELNTLQILTAGLLVSLSGAAGDLAASGVKRHFGVKDFGRLLGPLGGLLDRIDSLLGAGWVLFLYLQFRI